MLPWDLPPSLGKADRQGKKGISKLVSKVSTNSEENKTEATREKGRGSGVSPGKCDQGGLCEPQRVKEAARQGLGDMPGRGDCTAKNRRATGLEQRQQKYCGVSSFLFSSFPMFHTDLFH